MPVAPRLRSLLARALVGILLVGLISVGGAWLMHASIDQSEEQVPSTSAARHDLLGAVKSWGYQLQGLDVARASASPFDLLVIDERYDARRARSTTALKALKRKPDGSRRLLLAYLSIGEAEDYRPYWNRAWTAAAPQLQVAPRKLQTDVTPALATTPANAAPAATPKAGARALQAPTSAAPAWLGDENPEWRGNFHVRFWDESWQQLILGSETAALERIVAAGFDGVYLDRADAHQHWVGERGTAQTDMIKFIERISERARSIAPGFIVVMQNAEELLAHGRLRQALDAVAKEDLLHGIDGTEAANSSRDISSSIRYLKKAQGAGLPVLVVEYISDSAAVQAARSKLSELGFVPYFAPRALDRLRMPD